jgi:hypothetical protein
MRHSAVNHVVKNSGSLEIPNMVRKMYLVDYMPPKVLRCGWNSFFPILVLKTTLTSPIAIVSRQAPYIQFWTVQPGGAWAPLPHRAETSPSATILTGSTLLQTRLLESRSRVVQLCYSV